MFTSYERNFSEQVISRIYERMHLPARPAIVWCQSPWQLIMVPSLLPALFSMVNSEESLHHRGSNIVEFRTRIVEDRQSINSTVTSTAGLTPAAGSLFDQMWCRLQTAFKSIRWSGRPADLGPAFGPTEHELRGLAAMPEEAHAQKVLVTDLRERINSDYEYYDSRLGKFSLMNHFYKSSLARLSDSLIRYLVGLYADRGAKSSFPKADWHLAQSFFHTNLNFLAGNICYLGLGNQGCACIFFQHVCFVLERPLLMSLDSQKRLHREDGPAVLFGDGYSVYALEGIQVSRDMIEDPNWLTVDRIAEEGNQEIRRLMLKRYGIDAFLADANARKLSEDECGELFCTDLPGEDPLKFVKVFNSTPESDGTLRQYFLRVPPYVSSAREAVAWTFGLRQDEYEPDCQS